MRISPISMELIRVQNSGNTDQTLNSYGEMQKFFPLWVIRNLSGKNLYSTTIIPGGNAFTVLYTEFSSFVYGVFFRSKTLQPNVTLKFIENIDKSTYTEFWFVAILGHFSLNHSMLWLWCFFLLFSYRLFYRTWKTPKTTIYI